MSVIGGPNNPISNGLVYALDFKNNRSYVSGSTSARSLLFNPTTASISAGFDTATNTLIFSGSQNGNTNLTFPQINYDKSFTISYVANIKNGGLGFGGNRGVGSVSLYTYFDATSIRLGFYGAPLPGYGNAHYTRTYLTSGNNQYTWVYTTGSMTLFVNGVPVSSSAANEGSAIYNGLELKLSGRSSDIFWSGSLGNVFIYNRALTNDEIRTNYTLASREYGLPTPPSFSIDENAYLFSQTAGITSSAYITALDTFVRGLKSASLWDKMVGIYPFLGGNNTLNQLNLKESSLTVYPASFTGNWSSSFSGSKSNTTASYATLTGLTPSTYHPLVNSQSIHLSYLSYDTPVSGGYLMGVEQIPGLPGDIAAPAAAYSVRKVRTAYTGSCMDVRRDSDNTTGSIGFDAFGNLDTGSLLAFVTGSAGTGSGFVATWYDQSGNNNHATQSVANLQPLILSSGSITTSGGKPTLQLDGVNDYMTADFATVLQPNSYFIVSTQATTQYGFIFDSTPPNRQSFLRNFNDNAISFGTEAAGIVSTNGTVIGGSRYLFSALANGSNSYVYANNTLIASGNTGTAGISDMFIGTRYSVASAGNIKLQELILHSGSQSTNRQGIEYNINSYFNIYTQPVYNVNSNSLSLFSNASTVAGAANSVASASFTTGGPLGLITVTRTGSSDYALWKNKVPNRVTLPASLPQTSSFFLNAANVNSLVFSSSQNNVAYASVGAGLTDSEVNTYYDLVDTFQTNLGRRVPNPGAFITLWDTRLTGSGTSNSSSIVLPLYGTQAITASWGDGTTSIISSSAQVDRTHVYATPGIYTVTITGSGQGFQFANTGDRTKLLDIGQWGSISASINRAFQGATNVLGTAADYPPLQTTTLNGFFAGATRFNGNINNWNVVSCSNFTTMFEGATAFNQSLGNWTFTTTGSVSISMNGMFSGASNFNQDIGSWNTIRVTTMNNMFRGNGMKFNNGGSDSIKNWNTSNVTDMGYMFWRCAFNQPIGTWNVGNVTNFDYMFWQNPFNQNIGAWNVEKATSMSEMFGYSSFNNSGSSDINNWRPISCSNFSLMFRDSSFNQPIGNWPISASNINMSNMFLSNTAFNQNLGAWNVEKVTNMSSMFNGNGGFNNSGSADINNWRPISCSNFNSMFNQASAFNQPIGNWPLSASNIDMGNMFRNSNYNLDLGSWDVFRVTGFGSMFQQSGFNNGGSTNINNWQINTGSNVSFFQMFYQCPFNQPIGSWNVSKVTTMFSMFENNDNFNQNLNSWTPTSCSVFSRMFYRSRNFNQPIGGWTLPTDRTFTMDLMFGSAGTTNPALSFNQNIGAWNVSKATTMASMFINNAAFNNSGSSDINNWRPISCSNFTSMFQSATAFNQPIGNWPISASNISMLLMFSSNTAFNQNIGSWDVSKVTSMAGMFTGASAFNNSGSSDINNWRPISCSNFQSMFQGANAFNQPIGNWSISASSVDMSFMFYQNILFNQSLATWNTSKVTTMRYMFGSATSFNQNLGSWLIPSCSNMANMLDNCGMSKANYSSTLTGWAAQAPNIQSNVTLGASGRQYDTPGSASRAILTSAPYNWIITGDTYVP